MKVVIRKMSASGDTCFTCTEQELGDLLTDLEGKYQVAIRTGEGTRLLGNDTKTVLDAVEERGRSGAAEVELLLLPRVRGG